MNIYNYTYDFPIGFNDIIHVFQTLPIPYV
eukprot:COSAG06_NODE_1625_length_8891_cov_55.617379_7_plen_30_part_00